MNDVKIVSTSAFNGGVGKTTTGLTLAKYLSFYGPTMLIDANKQGNSTQVMIPDAATIKPENELASALRNQKVEPYNVANNLDILTGSYELSEVDFELKSQGNAVTTFRNWLRRQKIGKIYDYIVIDTHNDDSIITKNMLLASDLVLGLAIPDEFAPKGITDLLNFSQALRNEINLVDDNGDPYMTDNIWFVGNRVTRKVAGKQFAKMINGDPENGIEPHPLFLGYFHEREIFNTAMLEHKTIFDIADRSLYQSDSFIQFFEDTKQLLDKIKDKLDQA